MKYAFLFIALFFMLFLRAQNNLRQYEYWFDGDHGNKVTGATADANCFNFTENISTTGLDEGLHVFHVRFMDGTGKWGSTESGFFQIPKDAGPSLPGPCKITAYEYWTDTDYANKTFMDVAPPEDTFSLVGDLSLSGLTLGQHIFNIRFKDSCGQWSGVCSSFFLKDFEPPACMADAGPDQSFCYSNPVFPTLGGFPSASGGMPPYTYTWTAEEDYGPFTLFASDMLNDTTVANPSVISGLPENRDVWLYLTLTDAAGAVCTDSVLVQASSFIFHPIEPSAVICPGDSVRLQMKALGGFPPHACQWTGGDVSG